MGTINASTLLNNLKNVRWDITTRTYGNNHSTLIGLLVDWWISLSHDSSVLEGGPTNGYQQKGIRGQCDALFCNKKEAVGVLEIEGTRHKSTVQKVGNYFNARRKEFKTLYFGILLFYTYEAEGRGNERRFLNPAIPEALKEVLIVTKKHPDKSLIVITLNKKYNRQRHGVRSWNEYYMGQVDSIVARLFSDGRELKKLSLLKTNLTIKP